MYSLIKNNCVVLRRLAVLEGGALYPWKLTYKACYNVSIASLISKYERIPKKHQHLCLRPIVKDVEAVYKSHYFHRARNPDPRKQWGKHYCVTTERVKPFFYLHGLFHKCLTHWA